MQHGFRQGLRQLDTLLRHGAYTLSLTLTKCSPNIHSHPPYLGEEQHVTSQHLDDNAAAVILLRPKTIFSCFHLLLALIFHCLHNFFLELFVHIRFFLLFCIRNLMICNLCNATLSRLHKIRWHQSFIKRFHHRTRHQSSAAALTKMKQTK